MESAQRIQDFQQPVQTLVAAAFEVNPPPGDFSILRHYIYIIPTPQLT